MFGALTQKLQGIFLKLTGQKTLTEDNVSEAVREVRLALLEADVHYSVAKTLVQRVKEKALGEQVIKAVSPGQQFIKLVHDELVALMGGEEAKLNLSARPTVIMVCGLQGSGKTTFCAKLALFLKKKSLLVACDLQRPAAVHQLQVLGEQIQTPVVAVEGEQDPLKVAQTALKKAKAEGFDVLIVDTAGRLHVDEELMQQLERMKQLLQPHEVLFVANATTGQDAVNTANTFHTRIGMTGSVLTMLDGNTRGGAAISIREITGQPLKFEGHGERPEDLQLFNPTSMADRILGMGDTINLVKKAKEFVSEEDAKAMEQKLRKAAFTYEDYLKQMQMVKKMGSMKSLLKMLPGMDALGQMEISDKEIGKVEAIILSMTPQERQERVELVPSRRKRIALGSGTDIADVNKLAKSFKQAKQLFKNMSNTKQLEKLMGRLPWR